MVPTNLDGGEMQAELASEPKPHVDAQNSSPDLEATRERIKRVRQVLLTPLFEA